MKRRHTEEDVEELVQERRVQDTDPRVPPVVGPEDDG